MTHKEYAEKVWEDARCAFAEGALDCGGTEEAVFVIAASLEKQRVACAEAFYHGPRQDACRDGIEWCRKMHDAIRNAEVINAD